MRRRSDHVDHTHFAQRRTVEVAVQLAQMTSQFGSMIAALDREQRGEPVFLAILVGHAGFTF